MRRLLALALASVLVVSCTDGGRTESSTDTESLLEWQKDPGRLGQRWGQPVGELRNQLQWASADSERVYITLETDVVALDLDSGEELWRVQHNEVTGVPVVAGNRLIVNTEEALRIVALDVADGHQVWSAESQPFPGLAAGLAIVDQVDSIAALDSEDGREVWRAPYRGPVAAGNYVAVRTADEIIGLDARTGAEVWRRPRPATRGEPWVSAEAGLVVLAEALALDQPAKVEALDISTGQRRWEATLPAPTQDPPARLDDVLVFSTAKGVQALAIDDGTHRFSAVEDSKYPGVTACGDTVCVSAEDLRLLDTTGKTVQSLDLPELWAAPPVAFLNVIIILGAEGTVYRYR